MTRNGKATVIVDKERRDFFRFLKPLRLSTKLSVHIAVMLVIGASLVFLFLVLQYQQAIYRHEFQAAHTCYTRSANLLAKHYRDNANTFSPTSIESFLLQQFRPIHPDETTRPLSTPARIVLYGADAQPVFSYPPDGPSVFENSISVPDLDGTYTEFYDAETSLIRVGGPVLSGDQVIGYLAAAYPTTIEQELGALLKQGILVLVLILLIAGFTSHFFTRYALAPITGLTRAARGVQKGDLMLQVEETSDDEIGELVATFNVMVNSMSQRLNIIHRLQDWTVRLNRELDMDRIFEIMGEMFSSLSGSSAYRFYLFDGKAGHLEVCVERGSDDLPEPARDTLAQLALEERWAMFKKSDGHMDSEPEHVVELAIPLLSGQARIGVIRLGPTRTKTPYTDEVLTIIQTLAHQASAAIDNARMHGQLAQQERIEQEMMLAKEIQQDMLPQSLPEIPGYTVCGGSLPAYEVGGDYFDYVPSSKKGHHHFVIGDVAGKGVPAAMIMSIVRSLFHTYLEFETSPKTVLMRLNRNISKDIEPGTFVTLSDVDLDCRHHRISVVRAGHEPAILVRATGIIDLITPGGAAVGLLDIDHFNQCIEEKENSIRPGDTVILFTDGITEAINGENEEFGIERLLRVIRDYHARPVNELYEKILFEVETYAEGMPPADDKTLVIIRRDAV